MGRAVSGVLLLVIGLILAGVGAVAASTFGPGGTITTTSTPLDTGPEGYALVADVQSVSAGFPGSSLLGTPTLGADSFGTERLFVGIGSRRDVDNYLSGVAFEAVRQDSQTWQSLTIPGARKPGVPSNEDFWIRSSAGNAPSVPFTSTNSGTTFVIMRADGTRGVNARIVIGYTSAWVFPLAVGFLVVGVALAVWGLLRLRPRRQAPESDSEEASAADTPSEADVAAGTAGTAPAGSASASPPDDWFRDQEPS